MQSFLESSPNQEGFAFFYCNRTGEGSQRLHHILRSFVRQLSTTVRNPGQIRKRLRNVFDEARENGSGLSLDVCKEQLLESVNLYQKTTLVLDALDICERNTVLGLFRVIDDLLAKSERPLKVFISSRPNYEIRAHFASQPKIEIRAIDNESDIKIFVKNELNKPRRNWGKISTSLKNDIERVILQHSNGM
jgi:ankyrin repeat domain-containing protein 50